MFLSHVGPEGRLWKAWVAAHWERRLKRQDYLNADIPGTIAHARQHIDIIPLRCLGHLLVGFCRLLLRRVVLYDDRVEEVRVSLQMSREIPVPAVLPLSKEALTIRSSSRDVVPWEMALEPDLDVDAGLDMVFESPPLQDALAAGRRHTLP
jgi:hypothetical protein